MQSLIVFTRQYQPQVVHERRGWLGAGRALVAAAVELLAGELHHDHRVILQELEVHQLHVADVQDGGVWEHTLRAPAQNKTLSS